MKRSSSWHLSAVEVVMLFTLLMAIVTCVWVCSQTSEVVLPAR
jgi:hypothetical protein